MIKIKNIRDILSDKYQRKALVKVGSFFMAVSVFSGLASGTADYYINRETIVAVSENVRKSVYLDNIHFYHLNYTTDQIANDRNMTDKTLENTYVLDVDMLENNDLSFLDYCQNLQSIYIYNAQELTENDILLISQNKMKKVSLIFNHERLYQKANDKLNFGLINDKEVVVYSSNYYSDEQEEILFMHYLKNNKLELPEPQDPELRARALKTNEILDKIIESLNLDEYLSKWEKFIKICSYVTKRIDYDPQISEYIDVNGSLEGENPVITKAKNYNNYVLSTVLDEDIKQEVPGICVNYSNLLNALCIKAGIEAYVVDTDVNSDREYYHSWNIVKIDEDYQYVDLTAADNSYMYNIYTGMYFNGGNENWSKEKYSEFLYDLILNEMDQDYKEYYDHPTDFDKILYPKEKEVSIVNENTAGEKVFNNDPSYQLYTIIGLGNGLFAVALRSKIKEQGRSLIKQKQF